ncbi:hypothetical protein KCU95_g6302, partial [Aureobasidium melanogenum]
MESSPDPLVTTTESGPLIPVQAVRTRRINFLDLPSEVKNLVYLYLYRDRTKRAINLCVLSPAWKSPSPPTAFMNTCSTIASGLMPLYFSNCLFTIDTTHKANAQLLEAAFKWLKKVGDKSSAHFRRLHVIQVSSFGSRFEVMINVTNDKQVTVKQIKSLLKLRAEELRDPVFKTIYTHFDKELTDDLVKTLMHRVKTNETGAMGPTEFEIMLERIEHHVSWLNKRREELMEKGYREVICQTRKQG